MNAHQIIMETLAIVNGIGVLVLLLKNLLDMRKHSLERKKLRLEMAKLEQEVENLARAGARIVNATQLEIRQFAIEPFARELVRTAERISNSHLQLYDTYERALEDLGSPRIWGRRGPMEEIHRVLSENTAVQRELAQLLRTLKTEQSSPQAGEQQHTGS